MIWYDPSVQQVCSWMGLTKSLECRHGAHGTGHVATYGGWFGVKNKASCTGVLVVGPKGSPFAQRDATLLSTHFDVKTLEVRILWRRPLRSAIELMKLASRVIWADVTLSWFADSPAKWAVRFSHLFRRKAVVIVGGYEVANVPQFNYGAMIDRYRAGVTRYVLSQADRVIAVDEGLRDDAIREVGSVAERISIVPTGYDSNFFVPRGGKGNLVLTVFFGDDWGRACLKGIPTFIDVASRMPDVEFEVIGADGAAFDRIKAAAPQNVAVLGRMPIEQLLLHLQRARVYCQLSMREGLPNALCEAMLCECVPVGTDIPGVRSAMGECGFLVPWADVDATERAVRVALLSDCGKQSRDRIVRNYSLARRERDLVTILEDMTS